MATCREIIGSLDTDALLTSETIGRLVRHLAVDTTDRLGVVAAATSSWSASGELGGASKLTISKYDSPGTQDEDGCIAGI
jgi:hypothetical protein